MLIYKKELSALLLASIVVFIFDQYIKFTVINGFEFDTTCISFHLIYNKGVAFSMFERLGESLKYIQIGLLSIILGYTIYDKDILSRYFLPIGIVLGAGGSNILDRFIHGGVVDYVYWHCYFDFAIFNFADVMIDIAIVSIMYLNLRQNRYKI